MYQVFYDEVLDPSLQPDTNPRYTIKDNNGNIISDDVQIELKTPVVQNGTPLNKASISNIQGDLYTQDRYNTVTLSGNTMSLNMPLTAYSTNKIVNITAPATLISPGLNINGLGIKTVNGTLVANEKYTLIYNGSSWNILPKDYVIGTYTGDGESTRVIELGFRPRAIIVADKAGRFYGYNGTSFYSGGVALDGQPAEYYEGIKTVEIVDGGFQVRYLFSGDTRVYSNSNGSLYKYIAFK